MELTKLQLVTSMQYKGDRRGILEMRRHYSQNFKALPDYKDYRIKLVTEDDKQVIFSILDEINDKYGSIF